VHALSGQARVKRQARLDAVECLNLALLVHAQNQRPFRRVEVQPHNVGQLGIELASHPAGCRMDRATA